MLKNRGWFSVQSYEIWWFLDVQFFFLRKIENRKKEFLDAVIDMHVLQKQALSTVF